MLNEFNTAVAAEGVKMIAEGCKTITSVLESSDFRKIDSIKAQMIIYHLGNIAQSNGALVKIITDIGAKIDTKAGDF